MFISFDDGCKEDIQMAKLLNRFGLKAIFFIPTVCDLSEDDIRLIAKDHEIGGHTITHPADMKLLSDKEQFNEINDNRIWLKELTGQEVNWFCYPKGRYNEITINNVEKAGYKFARTTMVGYFDRPSLTTPTSVHIHPKSDWFNFALNNWENKNFHIWGHSWEVSKYSNWHKLELFYEHIYNTSK